MAWVNHWGINENDICRTLTMPKILLLLSLKRNSGVENLAVKRKLRYYKEVINPNWEYQKYLSVVTSK